MEYYGCVKGDNDEVEVIIIKKTQLSDKGAIELAQILLNDQICGHF